MSSIEKGMECTGRGERESGGKPRGDDKTFLVTVRFHLDTVECGWNVNKEGDELGGVRAFGVGIATLQPLEEMLRVSIVLGADYSTGFTLSSLPKYNQ